MGISSTKMTSETSADVPLEGVCVERDKDIEGGCDGDLLKDLRPCCVIINKTDTYSDELFQMLRRSKEDEFISFLTISENQETCPNLDCNDGKVTYLQYACENGLQKVAKYLIDSGANLHAVPTTCPILPLEIAIKAENFHIAQYIIDADLSQLYLKKEGFNLLHKMIVKNYISYSDSCMIFWEYLLRKIDHVKKQDIEVALYFLNEGDFEGSTPLDYAVESQNGKMIIGLLECGADFYRTIEKGDGAIKIHPEILEEYLDRKVKRDFIPFSNDVLFDYRFLIPDGCFIDGDSIKETSRILHLSQLPDFRHLVKHPLISTLIHLKWKQVRFLYFCNLLVYVLFCCLFTWYVLFHDAGQVRSGDLGDILLTIGLVICLIFLTVRELLQVLVSPSDYIRQSDNWIEMPLLGVATILIMFVKTWARQEISAIGILLTWTELILLLGRHPNLSTKVELYKRVSSNFFNFLSCYSLFIIAFALSFYTLSRNSNPESRPSTLIFVNVTKTMFDTVVRLSELNAGSFSFDDHPVVSHALFLMFLLFICFILLNLLNGLAVSDTQTIIDEAELLGLISRLNFISSIESTAQIIGWKSMRQFKIFKNSDIHDKHGYLYISRDDIEPSVLKSVRQIKKKCNIEPNEKKLHDISDRIAFVIKCQRESDKSMMLLHSKVETLLDRSRFVERLPNTSVIKK